MSRARYAVAPAIDPTPSEDPGMVKLVQGSECRLVGYAENPGQCGSREHGRFGQVPEQPRHS